MRLKLTEARPRLGEAIAHVQDPNEYCVLLRHGKPVAAIIGMTALKMLWRVEDDATGRVMHPLYDMFGKPGPYRFGYEIGLDGKVVRAEEAARQMHRVQMTRAEERRILQAGGLEEVEGGELRAEDEAELGGEKRGWWRRVFSTDRR
ncbi:MAG: hypothetical protein AAGL89_09995 [Pseudomonadota bacterium]